MSIPKYFVAIKVISPRYPQLVDAMDALHASNHAGFTLRAELDVKERRVIAIYPSHVPIKVEDVDKAPPLPPGQRYVILQENGTNPAS